MPDVSIVVVNWNTREMLATCLRTAQEMADEVSIELVVVDNASTDGSQDMLRQQFPGARLILNTQNVGFARANNQGVAAAQGRCVLLLNSDAFLLPRSLSAMVELADANPHLGLVGAHLLNSDGTFQASYTPFPSLWQEFLILSGLGRLFFGRYYPSRGPQESRGPQPVDYVEGACLLARREAYQAVGGMDEGFFMYAEEVDLCYALIRAGWQVWYHPDARVTHLGGASSRNRKPQREGDLYRSRVRFFRKHYGHGSANLLKAMIIAFTAVKVIFHSTLRWLSGGRLGRPVVSLGYLSTQLKEA
jgi:hypothetical protein